jgi:hypothetical protein
LVTVEGGGLEPRSAKEECPWTEQRSAKAIATRLFALIWHDMPPVRFVLFQGEEISGPVSVTPKEECPVQPGRQKSIHGLMGFLKTGPCPHIPSQLGRNPVIIKLKTNVIETSGGIKEIQSPGRRAAKAAGTKWL